MPKGKNKKVIGLIEDELGGKILIKFVGLSEKSYSYLIDDGSEDKKVKRAEPGESCSIDSFPRPLVVIWNFSIC